MYFCLTELFEKDLFMCIRMDLTLNNLQWLICHKTKPNQIKLCLFFALKLKITLIVSLYLYFVKMFLKIFFTQLY